MFEAGDIISGFVVEAHLGGGGAADVYRVHRTGAAQVFALKVIHTDATNRDLARERLTREFAIASTLHHPHIVATYEHGETSSVPPQLWMVMQYVDGPSASVLVPAAGRDADVEAVVTVAGQVAGALDYAHAMDVIHRDVKPANILLSADRRKSYLTDFGIAQLADDVRTLASNGRVQGSIAYAAPELLQGQQLSAATDLYALACSMFEWLTGAPPFPRGTAFAITYAHLRDPVPAITARRAWLPGSLNAVFAKALAKDPAARYESCAHFVDIVARTLRGIPLPQRS
ncbi:serine/threonine-protein kinase [Mycolicibacterium sp. 120266]|uniref:serine/threonine-protein kinase n=1 Tax=Mycolicibacterium sp. 120266 TaxID=3090601 RepID=UPI00299E42CA|nr:serine/threonine-protein kinase [Mycolicibacterium sp. 120266]MDX1871302.1 serine/threonine-protein kinase [Mycolicibacterium sp. 120266]